jgi:phosphate transport system permease protein
LASSEWNPVTQKFGAFPLIFGTVVSSLIALVIAGVVGILAAAYLADFAPRRLARPLAFVIELLAAVPSVVFGLWGLFVLAPAMRDFIDPGLRSVLGFLPLFQGPSYGIGLLTAGVLLALMIIPTVTAISRDVIAAIPEDQREASLSLGATRWETMAHVVLTSARAGIFGALILALGRALGETIAVTMVIGNRPQIVASLFAPSYSLASVIANEFTEATGDLYISALVELGLILLVISLVVNGIARLLMWTVFRKTGRAA